MEEPSGFHCTIYVNENEIYSGELGEVPEEFRTRMARDLLEWAGTLGKRGLNELIYSHLAWYEGKAFYCGECGKRYDAAGACGGCGGETVERYIHDRDKGLDMIITCVGMITKVEVSKI